MNELSISKKLDLLEDILAPNDKRRSLSEEISQLEKQYQEGLMTDGPEMEPYEHVLEMVSDPDYNPYPSPEYVLDPAIESSQKIGIHNHAHAKQTVPEREAILQGEKVRWIKIVLILLDINHKRIEARIRSWDMRSKLNIILSSSDEFS